MKAFVFLTVLDMQCSIRPDGKVQVRQWDGDHALVFTLDGFFNHWLPPLVRIVPRVLETQQSAADILSAERS